MNAETFAYWIQGAIELGQIKTFNEQQVQIIQDHLNLVFNKVTPQRSIHEILQDRFKQTPITTLPFPRIGDIPTDFAHQVTC